MQCSKCLLSDDILGVTLDADGVCNFCTLHDKLDKMDPAAASFEYARQVPIHASKPALDVKQIIPVFVSETHLDSLVSILVEIPPSSFVRASIAGVVESEEDLAELYCGPEDAEWVSTYVKQLVPPEETIFFVETDELPSTQNDLYKKPLTILQVSERKLLKKRQQKASAAFTEEERSRLFSVAKKIRLD